MTTIKNVGKFSFDELCKALEYDNENDFAFTPVNQDHVIKVLFNDYFPIRKLLNTPGQQDAETTIKVTEDQIEISLGQSITENDKTKVKLFAAIETVLADYLFRALCNYNQHASDAPAKDRILGTFEMH